MVFHQSCSDAIILVRPHAGKRTGQGGHFLQVKLCSKGKPRLEQNQWRLLATECDVRISGQLGEP